MVPFYTCSSFIFEISIIFIVSIIFSSINYDWKKSTLYKNYLISNNNKYVYYLSLFSTIIIFSFLMINLLLLILFILSKLNLLIGKWFMLPDDGSYSYNFKLLSFGSLYFSYIWIVTLVFFLSYIFNSLFGDQRSYYIFIFIIIIFSFLFGGTLNNFFNDLTYESMENKWYVFQKFNRSLYPKWVFYPSLFFPLYAPGQIISFTVDFTRTHNGEQFVRWTHFLLNLNILQWTPINSITGINAINWDIILITSAIWTFVLIIVSIFVSHRKKLFLN